MSESHGPHISKSLPPKLQFPWGLFLSACATVLVTLGLSFSLIYRNSLRLIEEDALVTHSYKVIGQLESLLAMLIDVETGQRGFVISGKEEFLEPFQLGVSRVENQLAAIRQLTADNERQAQMIIELRPLIERKLQISNQIIESRSNQGAEAAMALVAKGEGKEVMDSLRKNIQNMLDEENRLLLIHSDRSRDHSERANLQFVLISLIDIFVTSAALWTIYLTMRRRVRSEELLHEKQEQYVNETRAAARASEQARIATERAALFKEQLLSNTFHELRTPLTAILGFSENLKGLTSLDTDSQGALDSIHRNSQRLMTLVENLLQSAEAFSRGDPPASEPIHLLPVLRLAIQKLQPAMEAKGIVLDFRDTSENPLIQMNVDRCQTAFEQLIDNAVKFSTSGGKIRIEIRRQNQNTEIAVVDEGIGISKDVMPKLFSAFHQGDASLIRTHGGLGAGLFIARFFVETYGGTLTAESDGANQGARFTVSLPIYSKELNLSQMRSTSAMDH